MRHHAKTGTRSRMVLVVATLALSLASWPASSEVRGPKSEGDIGRRTPDAGQQAASSPSLDAILKEISTYDGGIESAAFWKLRDYVQAHKDDGAGRAECETKLLAFLKTNATPSARMAAGRWLRVVASERAVPALEALLLDARSSDVALYALQQIPGPEADKSLLRALSKTAGATKIAVIGALGQRRSPDAVAALAPLLGQPDLARPAAIALGAIGTDAAAQALDAAYPRVQADLKAVVGASMMQCAEKHLAAGNNEAARRVYEVLAADGTLPAHLRRAAAMGRISASGTAAPKILMAYLEGSDVAMQEAAIARLSGAIAPDAIASVCAILPRLPGPSQVQLLAVLSGYPKERVLAAILDAARADAVPVRVAAMNALQTTGDASVVPFLIEAAARTHGDEQAAARLALGMLKGRAVDEAILKMLSQTPPESVETELLLAIADRRIFPAKPVVAAALASASPRVRVHALRSLRAIGTPSDIPAVLTLLVKAEDEAERAEAEKTTAILAQKTANPDGRASAIRSRLMEEKDPEVRVKLIGLLPLVGDNRTLPLLRTCVEDANAGVSDAAVRALADWPTSAARDDALRLARDSRNETHRLLAIGGLVRMIGLDRYRDPQAAIADLRHAASFSWRPEEQRLVLAALPQFPCREALDLATGFLREPEVKAEAQAAIDKIKERLEAQRKRGT